MNELIPNEKESEIDLYDILAVIIKYKWIIFWTTLTAVIGILLVSIISLALSPEKSFLPNEYSPKANMLINDSPSSSGGLSSMLSSSNLDSLASLVGVNVSSGSSYSSLALFLAGSDSFLDAVVIKFNLVSRYKIKKSPRANSRKELKKKLSASFDEDSGVYSISFTDFDPEFAHNVVNFSVKYMEDRFATLGLDKNKLHKENLEKNIQNTYYEIRRLEDQSQKLDQSAARGNYSTNGSSLILEATRIKRELSAQEEVYTQLKIQYELIKVDMASETPVFQVLEYAEVPDQKSGPSRGILSIIVTFAAFLFSILLVFILNAIENIKKNPVAMDKLFGAQK